MVSGYERAIAVIATEHAIVDVVFSYIDRMNDATAEDSMDKIGREFREAVNPAIDAHLKALGAIP